MKRYVVGIILDQTLNYALLIHRNKKPYIGCLNGIGGKIEPHESLYGAMIRELYEETGIVEEQTDIIDYMMTISYPSNVELNVFYIIVDKSFNKQDFSAIDEGTIGWYSIKDEHLLDIKNQKLAGDGNIPYFIEYAILTEKWRRENERI